MTNEDALSAIRDVPKREMPFEILGAEVPQLSAPPE
jgi:hypothetical protein